MANVIRNSKLAAERAQDAADKAEAAAKREAFAAKRAALLIGSYCVGADHYSGELQAIVELVAVGANRMAIGALFQGISVDRPYMPTYSGTNNLYADEERASLIHYLVDECALIHPKHVDLIARVVALLGEPDTLRAYPSPVDPNLSLMISHLEEQIELFAEQGGLRAVRHP